MVMSASLRIALSAAAHASLALAAPSASASPSTAAREPSACAIHAPEAARRSGLPVDVILRVMQTESRGRPRAISHKGAMGCMQIMPGTWSYLTRRYGLGSDSWNPRMNMIGGALYLAEMVRQFGYPGAYSAYNAGPGRYRRHVRGGVPLPAETVAYTAQITGRAPRGNRGQPLRAAQALPRWQEALLFMPPTTTGTARSEAAESNADRAVGSENATSPHALFPQLRPVTTATGTQDIPPHGE